MSGWNLAVATVSAPAIVLGDYRLQTDVGTGAVTVAPVSAPPTQPPAPAVQPASIALDGTGISLIPSAEFGGLVPHAALLEYLLDVPIIAAEGIQMSLRSALGRLFTKVAADEAAIADISGNRIPALVSEASANAAADALRQAIQDAKDATQDTATAAAQLAAASAAMDIAAVADRVTALEGAPGFDSTALEARVTAAETAIGAKADQSAVDAALALKADQSSLLAVDARVTAEETATAAAVSRLDAVEAGVASKVAQADYDMYVASNDAAVALAQATATNAENAAADASTLAQAAEVKGLVSKLVVEDVSTAGISGAYWGETIGASLADKMDLGKLVNYIYDAPAAEITIPATVAGGAAAADSVRRLRNGHESAILAVSLGGVSYELMAGETFTFHFNGSAWRLA